MRCLDNPAILFGPVAITGLGVARNLGRKGVKVYCVTEQKNEVAYSRYCKKFFAVPQIERNQHVLRAFLSAIKEEVQHPSVLFPCSDMFCISLSQLKEDPASELSGQYVTFGRSAVIETLVNKRKFYQSLDKYGVPHPVTYFPETCEDVENISKQVEYPIYVRPSITQLFAKFKRKGLVARSQAELLQFYCLASKFDADVMIQEIIPGPATSMFGLNGYFDKMHDPRAFFAYHRLRHNLQGFDNSSLMESISISDVLSMKESIEGYLKKVGYHGMFDAEFKKDPRDGDFKLLEINARSWWQNSFPTKCGLNIVFMAYLDAIGERIDYEEKYETGVKWLFFVNDLITSLEMLHKRQIGIREWLSSLGKIEDYAYLAHDDLIPFIVSYLFLSSRYARELHAHALVRLSEVVFGKRILGTKKNERED